MTIRDNITRAPFILRHLRVRPDQGRIDTATSWEIEYPYRQGTSVIIRLFRSHAVLAGILDDHPSLDDDEIDYRLLMAIRSTDGGDEFCAEAWERRARIAVGRFALDDDDAAEISQMLGLDDERTRVVPADGR